MNSEITYVLDGKDRIVATNQAFATYQGVKSDLLKGKSIYELMSLKQLNKLYSNLFNSVRKSGQKVAFNFRQDDSKKLRITRMEIAPLKNLKLRIKTSLFGEIDRKQALSKEIFHLGLNIGVPICTQCNQVFIEKAGLWFELDVAITHHLMHENASLAFDICPVCSSKFKNEIDNIENNKTRSLFNYSTS